MPNGTFSKVEFDPWQQITSDENDTVLQSRWYSERGSPIPPAPEPNGAETRAAWLAAKPANTPSRCAPGYAWSNVLDDCRQRHGWQIRSTCGTKILKATGDQ